MRVALVCPYSWSVPGGVQAHVAGLAGRLRSLGHDVDVVAPADGPVDLLGFVPAGGSIPIPDNRSIVRVALGPGAVQRVARLARGGAYDVIHVHEPMIPAVSLTAVLAASAPVVGTFHMYAHGRRWYRPFAPLAREIVPRLAARIAVSKAALRHVVRTIPGEYRIIPNGIDVGSFAIDGRRDGTRVLFVGRPDSRKGLPVLLEAFAALPARTELDLVGVTAAQLDRLAGRLPSGVVARIRPCGRVTDAERAAMLASADVLCAPSLEGESFGIVLVEGMAAGLPVVASEIPGYVDVLPERCGRLVPPGDRAALARVLAELLEDGDARARFGAAGREAARRYDWSIVAGEILGVYEDVLERRRATGADRAVATIG